MSKMTHRHLFYRNQYKYIKNTLKQTVFLYECVCWMNLNCSAAMQKSRDRKLAQGDSSYISVAVH